jgi:hypothetical protein
MLGAILRSVVGAMLGRMLGAMLRSVVWPMLGRWIRSVFRSSVPPGRGPGRLPMVGPAFPSLILALFGSGLLFAFRTWSTFWGLSRSLDRGLSTMGPLCLPGLWGTDEIDGLHGFQAEELGILSLKSGIRFDHNVCVVVGLEPQQMASVLVQHPPSHIRMGPDQELRNLPV